MAPNKRKSNFESIDVYEISALLFGRDVAGHSANPRHCPGELRQIFQLMKMFEERVRRAIDFGLLRIAIPSGNGLICARL